MHTHTHSYTHSLIPTHPNTHTQTPTHSHTHTNIPLHPNTHPPWSFLCIGQLLLGIGPTLHWRIPILPLPDGINCKQLLGQGGTLCPLPQAWVLFRDLHSSQARIFDFTKETTSEQVGMRLSWSFLRHVNIDFNREVNRDTRGKVNTHPEVKVRLLPRAMCMHLVPSEGIPQRCMTLEPSKDTSQRIAKELGWYKVVHALDGITAGVKP